MVQQAIAQQANGSRWGESSYEDDALNRALAAMEMAAPYAFPRASRTVPWMIPIYKKEPLHTGQSFTVDLDTRGETGIIAIHACYLQITRRELRSTITVVGGNLASAGTTGGPSTPDTSGPSTPDTSGATDHRHIIGVMVSLDATHTPPGDATFQILYNSSLQNKLQVGWTVTSDILTNWETRDSGTHSHTLSSHTHTLSAHTHTTGNHSHTNTITYGIFKNTGVFPSVINIIINGTNRTAALGGPWSANVRIDIATYLIANTSTREPLRQINTIEFTSSTLGELEITGYMRCNGREVVTA